MSLAAATCSTTGTTRSISSANVTSGVSGENGTPPMSIQSAPACGGSQRGGHGVIQREGAAMVEEGIGRTIHDSHHDDLMIKVESASADRTNRIPQRRQVGHGASLNPPAREDNLARFELRVGGTDDEAAVLVRADGSRLSGGGGNRTRVLE